MKRLVAQLRERQKKARDATPPDEVKPVLYI